MAYIALTASRTVALPAASAYPAGAVLTLVDESGACSPTVTLTLAAAGSDRINGAASAVIAAPYGYLQVESNTSNKWTVVDAPAPVLSVAGRTGAVALAVADVAGAAPLASPALTGTPTAPNAAAGTNSGQVATTSFVAASFVTYGYAGANYATAKDATLAGTPTAPTAAVADNSARIATTAYADRAAAQGALARTQVADAAYTVLPSDRVVAVTALTASRTLTLPAASAFPQGATLTLVDESGACSATSAVAVARASTADAINGAASAVIAAPYGYLALESNGSNKWTVVDQSTLGMAQQSAGAVAISGGTIDGTAVGGTTPASGAFTTIATTSSAAFSGIPQARNTNSNSYAGYWEVYTIDGVRRGYFGYGDANSNITLTGDNGWGVKIGGAACSILPALTLSSTLRLASYTVATLPAAGAAGRVVQCSNARMFNGAGALEASGSGTGGPVVDNGAAWKIAGTNVTASA